MTVYLSDMHAGITGQRTSRCEVIRPQQGWDDAIPVYFPDHGTIHKVDEPVLIHSNACVDREIGWVGADVTAAHRHTHTAPANRRNTTGTHVTLAPVVSRSLKTRHCVNYSQCAFGWWIIPELRVMLSASNIQEAVFFNLVKAKTKRKGAEPSGALIQWGSQASLVLSQKRMRLCEPLGCCCVDMFI